MGGLLDRQKALEVLLWLLGPDSLLELGRLNGLLRVVLDSS